MVLRLSVPAAGGLRIIAGDLAVKIADDLGAAVPDAEPVAEALEVLAGRVAPPDHDGDISFEFRRSGHELLIQATCAGQTSELRYLLPV